MRRALLIVLGLLIASISPVAASESGDDALAEWADQDYCEYFEETDKYLCFGFRSYWHEYGGLEVFGYPISNEIQEDGKTVQYFERARLEWHPGVWPERHDVLQGLLGVEVTADMSDHEAFQPADPSKEKDDCVYFEATGHNVCDEFLERWEMSGGLPVFGYPISEAYEEDGILVQYFERQRMEHQPGVWPERHDVLLGLLGVEVYSDDAEPEPEPQPELSVIASDLVQPRGLFSNADGVYIAEAGVGGDGDCVTNAEGNEVCLGASSAITLASDGDVERVVEGLPSLGAPGADSTGAQDLVIDDEGNMFIVVGLGASPEAKESLGEAGEMLGTVVKVNTEGEMSVVADLNQHEADNNPDGADPPDSNPYGIAMDGDDLIVADAGANALLRVSQAGDIETIAVFPPRMVEAPPFIDAPEVPMESVPTNVAVGPDGNYYVTELTGFPFPVGGAVVYQVTPDGEVSTYAEGFTNLGDLAIDDDGNVWVLEILAGSLLNADPEDPSTLASRIVKIDAEGEQTEYMFQGMGFATGIEIGAEGEIYVSNLAVTPDAHVLRIDLP